MIGAEVRPVDADGNVGLARSGWMGRYVKGIRRVAQTFFRLGWLGGELGLASLAYLPCVLSRGQDNSAAARSRWLHRSSRRVLRVFGVRVIQVGSPPMNGLLVCNHLSYLDILVLASVVPAVFVAKADVRRWPLLGRLARWAGTVFVCRERRSDVARVNAEIRTAIKRGLLVVVFPEGTSSGGDTVLPFKSSLLEVGTEPGIPLSVAGIRYSLPDGDPRTEVCYWRDMTLLPHLLNLLGRGPVAVQVAVGRFEGASNGRKELAQKLHAHVLRLHQDLTRTSNS